MGKITLIANQHSLVKISLTDEEWRDYRQKHSVSENCNSHLFSNTVQQLEEYFNGKRMEFQLPIKFNGTEFQQKVWRGLQMIPYGQTWSYSDLAQVIQNEKAVRAVGQANRVNPLPIIIPCHRVIGKNKQLTGYAGSRTDLKAKLLYLEAKTK